MKNHKIPCEHCNYKFSTNSGLQKHLKNIVCRRPAKMEGPSKRERNTIAVRKFRASKKEKRNMKYLKSMNGGLITGNEINRNGAEQNNKQFLKDKNILEDIVNTHASEDESDDFTSQGSFDEDRLPKPYWNIQSNSYFKIGSFELEEELAVESEIRYE